MTSHLWTGVTIAFSVVGLAVGVAQKSDDKHSEKVDVPKMAVAVVKPTRGNKVRGVVRLTQTEKGVRLQGRVRNLTPGKHGFHIHEFGDLRSPDGTAAGGHFNPDGHDHGGLEDDERHAGDLGNITADANGVAQIDVVAKDLKLHFVIGRSIVVHGKADDLKSQPSGDAGPRVALGVIGFAQAMKKKRAKKAARQSSQP